MYLTDVLEDGRNIAATRGLIAWPNELYQSIRPPKFNENLEMGLISASPKIAASVSLRLSSRNGGWRR